MSNTQQPEWETLREKLAALAHEQWSGWMGYLFSKCEIDEVAIIPKWAVDRWQRQIRTPYVELSEEEKNSDREEADKYLAILSSSQQELIAKIRVWVKERTERNAKQFGTYQLTEVEVMRFLDYLSSLPKKP